ncbi:unnamed protein product [Brassicogethes aeneus]|uniref:Calcineurin-binding protein cabin-1 n=1 Tax=Brassicogethes aeneus TaxID=1431903 RepID=A0A9P0ARM4_BRAAE|nr:unnamed protein product [Brassicogethes aeneus]
MLKIRALNRESSSDEDVPVIRREAQEEIALELYNKSLRFQKINNIKGSEAILLKLIEENIPLLENNGGLPKSMSTLKFSCYLNLGHVYLKQENTSKALENYLTASELDGGDVTLWYKIGKLSIKEGKFRQSSYAFSKGLECSESHWPCLDNLISVLFAIRDTVGCLCYITKALIKDADYTKGLVIRAQIYRDNPGTKDYYKLYNPDHIWEPPLDVTIDKEEEKLYLEEADELRQKVLEIEKSLAPKPLQVIPLPKPLEDFTWLSLAKTVVHLHQYITDNEMSHFTMFDMSKCMSQTEPMPQKNPVDIDTVETKDQKSPEPNESQQELPPPAPIEEKMEVEAIIERRFSQTSETNTNNDGQEHTPVQTDNDEEQATEQETEDQDENDSKLDKSKPIRGTKRKRDLLSDLQIWGWHSKRKCTKKGNKDKDFSIEDALNRIIPNYLLENKITNKPVSCTEDSMNTMDLYKLYVEDNEVNLLSPISSPKSGNPEPYFGTNDEREDVQQLWTKPRPYTDAIVLIKDFVISISKFWNHKWTKELISLYVSAYSMYREHYDLPQVFCNDSSFEEIRDDALATLLYGELLHFTEERNEQMHISYITFLQHVSGWSECWKEEYSSFFNRVYWLRAHLFRMEHDNDLAERALQLVEEIIEDEEKRNNEKYYLLLPNCTKYGIITSKVTEKILKHLDLINSLSSVENLYKEQKYTQVANIIKATFTSPGSNNIQVGRMGRPAQLGILLHSLWFTDMNECFVWTEVCLYESLENYLKPSKDHDKWEKMVDKCLAILHEIIKSETVSVIDVLPERKRKRFVESLSKVVRKQLNSESPKMPLGIVTPWILLHYVLLREEHRSQANKKVCHVKNNKSDPSISPTGQNGHLEGMEEELPPSIAILFSAHEFLGPKGWCLTGRGELLHFILDTILDRLDTPIFEHLREKIDIHMEQALFCLYQYPPKTNKVSRHLADHNVDPLSLTWERAFQLYEFYGPDCLPEFNSYKNVSITADLEQLLKRIIALVPPECDPKITLPKVTDYLSGKIDTLPEPLEFPNKVRAIYYLIGDYYFKQREFNRCMKYFQMDICINPLRLDSWACLGLGYSSQLDSKLNYCKKIVESEFLDIAKSAQVCFKKALSLAPDHLMLWIECGSFEYMVHSYCSRLLKYESENFSMEKFELLETQKEHYLDSSGTSLENAIALYEESEDSEPDERWLQYYIIGKIAEKKQKEPQDYLQYYITASTFLHENAATYPDKINYNNPQHLAVEALELHYRINASVLKFLELHEGKDIPHTMGSFFRKCLHTTLLSNITKPLPPKPVDKPPVETPSAVPQAASNVSFQDQFLSNLDKNIEQSSAAAAKCNEANKQNKVDKELKKDVREFLMDTIIKVEEKLLGESKMELDNAVGVIEQINLVESQKKEELLQNVKEEMTTAERKLQNDLKVVAEIVILSDSDEDDIIIARQTEEGKKYQEQLEKQRQGKNVDENSQPKQSVPSKQLEENTIEEKKPISFESKDVQKLLDEMMEETMKKAQLESMDIDSDVSFTEEKKEKADVFNNDTVEKMEASEIISISEHKSNKPDEIKTDIKDEEKKKVLDLTVEKTAVSEKAKSVKAESEADDIRTSVDDDSSSSSSSSSSSTSSSESDSDDSSSSASSSESVSDNENMSNSEILALVEKCIAGLELCIQRLPQNYKALYRLAHVYFNYKTKKDFSKSKQLLLSEYKCNKGDSVINGLFADRKANNFFNGIWRIPSTEIDRPGSLSAHMNRCISLLLQILQKTNDTKTLLDLCTQLKRPPDPDKIYIKDSDRLAFSEQAMTMCIQCLRSQMKNIPNMNNTNKIKLLQDIYRVYLRVQKNIPGKESVFAGILIDCYKKFREDKLPENINVLDCAKKFCEQNKVLEKTKSQIQSSPNLSRSPGLASAPVLPSPSTLQYNSRPAPKRPVAGRPRGRPPLPKVPGQVKTPRGKSPIAASYKSMYERNVAIEYMKQYQELINKYSKNMTLPQLQHFSQLLTQSSLPNPLGITSGLSNQFMSNMANLMNPASLAGLMGAGDLTQSQLMSSFNQLSPTTNKKSKDKVATTTSSNVINDQLKYLSKKMQSNVNKPTSSKKKEKNTMSIEQLKYLNSFQNIGNKPNTSINTADISMASGTTNIKSNIQHTITQTSSTKLSVTLNTSTASKISSPSMSSSKLSVQPTSTYQKSKSSSSHESGKISVAGFASCSKFNTTSSSSMPKYKVLSTLSNVMPKAKMSTTTTKSSYKYPSAETHLLMQSSLGKSSNPKVFKEPSASHKNIAQQSSQKYPIASSPKSAPTSLENPSVFLKERPSISITPVTTTISTTAAPFLQTSPGKTLQEKLADKKKQHTTKSIPKNLEPSFSKEALSSVNLMKNFNLPNIPASLSVSKSMVSTTQMQPHMSNSLSTSGVANLPSALSVSNIPSSLSLSGISNLPSSLSMSSAYMGLAGQMPMPKYQDPILQHTMPGSMSSISQQIPTTKYPGGHGSQKDQFPSKHHSPSNKSSSSKPEVRKKHSAHIKKSPLKEKIDLDQQTLNLIKNQLVKQTKGPTKSESIKATKLSGTVEIFPAVSKKPAMPLPHQSTSSKNISATITKINPSASVHKVSPSKLEVSKIVEPSTKDICSSILNLKEVHISKVSKPQSRPSEQVESNQLSDEDVIIIDD